MTTRALCLLAFALPLAAQPKLLVNAQLKTQSAASGLETTFRALLSAQPQPAWIGYSVPAVRPNSLGCEYVRENLSTAGIVHLEPPDSAIIMFRVDANAVTRIRSLSPYCGIDAGGVPVHWLNDVQPAQSVALLSTFVSDRERFGDSIVGAIAQHSDASADQALDRFLAATQPFSVRQRAVSWMGTTRGRRGFDVLKKLIAGDPDERIRERAINALANSREPDAADLLTSIARTDKNVRMREQAVSALSRRQGPAIVETLSKIIESDPEIQVKRRAIQSLNGLPEGAGVPVLIQVVRTSQNAEVRKHAMNTLQQSRDPRAMAFFEDVLKK
jgi:HEAT repeat protein